MIVPHFFDPTYIESLRSLALAVAECNFKVRVLTTFSKDHVPPLIHKNVEILQPFKKWNLFEMGDLLRSVHGFQPEVVHFVMPPATLLPGKAIPLALPGALQSFGRPGFLLQLQGPIHEPPPLVLKYWLQLSQVVVVNDDFTKLKVSAMTASRRNQSFHVLKFGGHDIHSSPPHWISESFDTFFYACGPVRSISQLTDSLETLKPFLKMSSRNSVVFHLHADLTHFLQSHKIQHLLAEWNLIQQVILLKSMDSVTNRQLIQHCAMVSLTHLPLGSPDIATALKMSREAGKRVLVQPSVMSFEHSMKEAWSLAVTPDQLTLEFLAESSATPIEAPAALDSLGNQLSRIYQSLISH